MVDKLGTPIPIPGKRVEGTIEDLLDPTGEIRRELQRELQAQDRQMREARNKDTCWCCRVIG